VTWFAERVNFDLEENELSLAARRCRERGERFFDLTLSNPTRAGLALPAEQIRKSLGGEGVLAYEPDPRGPRAAREAISAYYRARNREIEPDELFLTASTSEAYGFLFKLLCDPADEVLVPVPSYPLFDFLTALDAVRPRPYPLRFDGSWQVDFAALESLCSGRTRAIVAVHPNNPTGSYLSAFDRENLVTFAARRRIPLIVDEVFLDYSLSPGIEPESLAGEKRGLVLVLSGLSKLAGLPQMKLAWIAVSGEREAALGATRRLELIGDTYLSVGAPVAVAAPRLLELAPRIAALVSERIRENLKIATDEVARLGAVSIVPSSGPEGGWYLVLRLPSIASSEEWAIRILETASVYVHPGSLFGFQQEATLVLSLLTPPETFQDGIVRLLGVVRDRLDSPDA
jgi:aspartate/methionine/tyrosine aminotransferase